MMWLYDSIHNHDYLLAQLMQMTPDNEFLEKQTIINNLQNIQTFIWHSSKQDVVILVLYYWPIKSLEKQNEDSSGLKNYPQGVYLL